MKKMGAEGKLVLLPTLGGQTALNTAMALHRNGALARYGVEMIGAKPDAITKGEDRLAFKELMLSIGLDVPVSGVAHNLTEACDIAEKVGRFPLIIRPAFTLGGTASWSGENYVGVAQRDSTTTFGLRAEYHVSRELVLKASASRQFYESNSANSNYVADVFMLGLKLQR